MQTIRAKSLKRAQGFNLLLLLDSAGGKLTSRLNISLQHVLHEGLDVEISIYFSFFLRTSGDGCAYFTWNNKKTRDQLKRVLL